MIRMIRKRRVACGLWREWGALRNSKLGMQSQLCFTPVVRRPGFTIIEVMLAIGIFAMVLTAIYATWMAILKGSRAALSTAAAVQRARITVKTLEDAFLTVRMFNGNVKHYLFMADTSGDYAAVSMAAKVPPGFPGVNRYGDVKVRRVSFYVRAGKDGNELVMEQAGLLQDTNTVPAYSLVLAKDVSRFKLEFYDALKNEWLDEWKYTNQLPKLVQVQLGLGRVGNRASGEPHDLVAKLVNIPSLAVSGDIQGAGPQPGAFPGNPQNPGVPNNPRNPSNPNNQRPGNPIIPR